MAKAADREKDRHLADRHMRKEVDLTRCHADCPQDIMPVGEDGGDGWIRLISSARLSTRLEGLASVT